MADSSKQSKVDGKAVTVSVEDAQIRWTHEHVDDGDNSGTEVAFKNIIAILPASSGLSNEHTLLHVTENDSTNDGDKASPLVLKARTITDFPESFTDSYRPKARSFWHRLVDRSQKTPQINVIISTGSGTGLASPVWEKLVEPILAHIGLPKENYTAHYTASEDSVTQLTKDIILPIANNGEDQFAICLTGDGGIVDIVNTLLSAEHTASYRNPTIALLPLGTGNALASSAVVAGDNTMGLRTLLCSEPKELPMFRTTFSEGARLLVSEGRETQPLQGVFDGSPAAYGAVVCSWGLHATLVADSDTAEYRKFGAERFKMAANEALFPSDGSSSHAYKGTVSLLRPGKQDWEDLERKDHGYVLATLVSNLEAAFTISPASRPLDGKLRIVHFGHVSGQEAIEIMTKAYQGGQHVDDDRLGYEEIEGLRIQFHEDDGRWRRVCIDGKIIRVEEDGWMEVRAGVKSVVDLLVRDD